ncbi:MAG: hypothetical protein LBM20_01660 [Rikenellaceae bacterium]|jgi:hypothetical protein|nr:hypothetical protein [Rikenellaceae bacterium]
MHNKIYGVFMGLMALMPLTLTAQHDNSLNAFSPFTFYGLGDILPVGTASTQSMGGVGVAYWTPYEVNLVNPAAYSQIPRQSGVLSMGASGKGVQLSTNQAKTFENTFNLNNFGFMLPLGRGVGFALSLNPYSGVGYRSLIEETNTDIMTDVGSVIYNYTGEGGVTRAKVGIGAQLFKGFSLGADLIAYMGNISRYSYQTITAVDGNSYRAISEANREEVADISFDVGFQYQIWRTTRQVLTVGATYQPDATLNNRHIRQVYDKTTGDSIFYAARREEAILPQKVATGVYYQTQKFGAALDYSYQDWSNAYRFAAEDRVTMKESQALNFGMHYTPNRTDIRRALNRWTYRAGFRYADLNIMKDGVAMNEMALTFGVGIPLRSDNYSEISIGLEVGQRGKTGFTPSGLPMVKEQFFKLSIGVSIFDTNWFVKMKYY